MRAWFALSLAASDLMALARSRALLANIGYGVGAAAVVGGAILWFTGAPRTASGGGALALRLSPEGVVVSLAGGF
jgi:hypothetical protein